ncbi:MAG: hypothetical protein V4733_03765 [Verrucomicrobiota bacterium]
MVSAKINTGPLQAGMREFANVARKDLGEVAKQQAGILVGHVIALTPPGSGGVSTEAGGIPLIAKKSGESRIAADIAKIFPTTRLPEAKIDALIDARHEWEGAGGQKLLVFRRANTLPEMKIVHREARNPRSGRTRVKGGRFAAIVRPALLKAYIRQEKAKVGVLNSGWLAAARDLKTASRNVPAWIKRHGASNGGSSVAGSGASTSIRIYNNLTWFPSGMAGRVQIAVSRRTSGLKKAVETMIERKAKAVQRRLSR